MGRMNDALRKAAEERERKRRMKPSAVASPSEPGEGVLAEAVTLPATTEPEAPESGSRVGQARAKMAAEVREATDPELARGGVGRAPKAHGLAPAALSPSGAPSRPFTADPRIVAFHSPRDPRAEQFRSVRTALLALEPLPKTVMVTSGSPGEGKSLAAVNLACSLVEGGNRRVLLVDGNLRHPELDGLCGARAGRGLSDLLAGEEIEPTLLVQPTALPGVDLLPAGQTLDNPGSILSPRKLQALLAHLAERYDFLLLDTAALQTYADTSVMAADVDGVLLIVQMEGPPRSAVERAVQLLEKARARVVGVVAMNCRS